MTRADPGRRTRQQRHDDAVIQAEVRALVRELRPDGVPRKDALVQPARTSSWHSDSFEDALSAAVRTGALEPLALDFYRHPEMHDLAHPHN